MGEAMPGGDKQASRHTNIAHFPLREAPAMTKSRNLEEARSAVLHAAGWAETTQDDLCINLPAVRYALAIALHWLDVDASTSARLDAVHDDLVGLAKAHTSFDWLFDKEDQPKLESITPDVFERLVELRVLADRILRTISA
jgi:hypothetical protein